MDDKPKPSITGNHTRAFYPIEEFPRFKLLEENYQNILQEFLTATEDRKKRKSEESLFEPWVEKNLYEESNEDGWDVAPLMIGGNTIEGRCKKFKLLHELTSQISGIVSISFSLLKPGTHIVPHKGYDDYSERVLRFHMGLIVPEGDVGIRVEKEIRKWENGKSFIFDDFLIHEAWNFSDKDRVVLIIDFLREEQDGSAFVDRNFNNSIKTYLKN
jgi:aspartyl/asparaginyl beta-hydroxylase (cupin superfamily)